MMHDPVSRCHIDVPVGREIGPNVSVDTPAKPRDFEPAFEYGEVRAGAWVPARAETIDATASRHSSPRAWRRALEQAIGAGLIPGATSTTLTVADNLRKRMGFGTGHAAYCLDRTVVETGLGRSTVTKHVALLRSHGWLAWAAHGSLRNALRAAGRRGYAATATVYAATIPPVFDEWAGHRIAGTGYRARVVGVTVRGREQRVAEAVDNSVRKAVDNGRKGSSWTPSLRVVKEEGQVQVVGGSSTAKRQRKTATTILGHTITAHAVATAKRIAAWIRPLVTWCQRATRRQLSWVLLDLVLRGWDEQRILAWLQERCQLTTWRPRFPHRHIAAALIAQQADEQRIADYDTDQATRVRPQDNAAWAAWSNQNREEQAQPAKEQAAMAALAAAAGLRPASRYTDAERRQHRLWALDERFGGLSMVAAHVEDDFDDAVDLYGIHLCCDAQRFTRIGALA